jgi:8-oxo-dGTP diphosphatase
MELTVYSISFNVKCSDVFVLFTSCTKWRPVSTATASIRVSVEIVALTLVDGALCVLLEARERAPFKGRLALPGGTIDPGRDESAEGCALRVLREKLGPSAAYLEQLRTFSGATRDPRGWALALCYLALWRFEASALAGWGGLRAVPVRGSAPLALPFDQRDMLEGAVGRLASKSTYSSLPCYLAAETFTRPQLQSIYETLRGERIHRAKFNKRLAEMEILEVAPAPDGPAPEGRPPQYYRLKQKFRRTPMLLERTF